MQAGPARTVKEPHAHHLLNPDLYKEGNLVSRSIIPWRASAGGHESTRERLPRLPSSRNSQLMTEAHTVCKEIDATYYLVGDQSIIQKKSKRHSIIDCAYECWHK